MFDLPDFAAKDIGPLPAWGWMVAAVGGIGLGWGIRRATDGRSAAGKGSSAGGSVADLPGFTAGAGGVGVSQTAGVGAGRIDFEAVGFDSNLEWRQAALELAIDSGWNATAADQALTQYLNGDPMTAEVASLIDLVLPDIGLPPSPPEVFAFSPPDDLTPAPVFDDPIVGSPPVPPSSPPPAPVQPSPPAPVPPPVPPTALRVYRVVPGDSLSLIARKMLGDGNRWPDIYNLNRDTIGSNPDLIFPGQELKLPN